MGEKAPLFFVGTQPGRIEHATNNKRKNSVAAMNAGEVDPSSSVGGAGVGGDESRRTVLGTRPVVEITNERNGSATTATMFVDVEMQKRVLQVQLCDGSSGNHGGTIPLEKFKSFLGDVTNNDRLLSFLRRVLLLRGSTLDDVDEIAKISGLHLSFRYKTGCQENSNNQQQEQEVEMMLTQTKKKGMVQRIYETLMSKSPPSSSATAGVLNYCQTSGDALNEALQEIEQLKKRVHYWQDTAKRLDNNRERDYLLENFNKLRLESVTRHKRELEDLRKEHEMEKLTWASSRPSTAAPGPKKPPRQRKTKDDDEDEMNDANNWTAPWKESEGRALKDGKRLPTSNRLRKKRALEAGQATDMKEVFSTAKEYESNKMGQTQKKKKKKKHIAKSNDSSETEGEQPKKMEESGSDNDDVTVVSDASEANSRGIKGKSKGSDIVDTTNDDDTVTSDADTKPGAKKGRPKDVAVATNSSKGEDTDGTRMEKKDASGATGNEGTRSLTKHADSDSDSDPCDFTW